MNWGLAGRGRFDGGLRCGNGRGKSGRMVIEGRRGEGGIWVGLGRLGPIGWTRWCRANCSIG